MILLKKVIMNGYECLSHCLLLLTIAFLLMFLVNVETKTNDDCKCGIENKVTCEGKNGSHTNLNKYPWSIALKINGKVLCGGSLLSNKHVLTAAHCLKKESNIHLVKGEVCVNTEKERLNCYIKPEEVKMIMVDPTDLYPKKPFDVQNFHIHPDYNPGENLHDIAIVALAETVRCNSRSRPVCLPSEEKHEKSNAPVYFAGWAPDPEAVYEGTYEGPQLRQEKFRIWPVSRCVYTLKQINHKIQHPEESVKKFICASGASREKNDDTMTCGGDSGSGLSRRIEGLHYVVGVNSFHSSSLCDPEKPAIFTKVISYKRWINSILSGTTKDT